MNRFAIISVSLLTTLLVSRADAHVGLEKKEATVGASYKGVLTVPHGCSGSATTKVAVTIPEGVIAVKPMPKPGWNLEIVKGAYQRSYDFMHGVKMSDGVKQIIWSGGKLNDDFYDEFVFTSFIPDSLEPNQTLVFPVEQICERGTESWTEIAAPGQNPHHLKSPAPTLRLISAAQKEATFTKGTIVVKEPWARATPKGAKVGGTYLTLSNNGTEADRLLRVSGAIADKVEIHEMTTNNGVMTMRPLEKGIAIEGGKTIQFAPNGYHIMLNGLSRPLSAGEDFTLSLEFERAGLMAIKAKVFGIGTSSTTGADGHAAHDHSKM